jgi:HEAT repeat protein
MAVTKVNVEQLAARKDVSGLVEALKHDDSSVRHRAAGALSRLGAEAKAAVPALIEALGHWDSMTRAAAAGALGAIGPDSREAISVLERALTDADPVVKMCAASALRDICPGSGERMQALTAMLNQKNRPRPKGVWEAIGESMSTPIDPILFYANPFF